MLLLGIRPIRQKVRTVKFEIIDESAVVAVKRGRKSTAPQELVDALRTLASGKVISIRDMGCDPKSPDYTAHKTNVSATIRSAGRQAGVKVGIEWHPSGYPQVRTVTPKVKPAKK